MVRIKYDIEVPEDIKYLHKLFKANGFKLHMVGGCVRDSILKLKIKDYDLTTNANPEEVQRLTNNKTGEIKLKSLAIGEQFGVISVITSLGGDYEIATWRSDSVYSDGRRPDKVTFGTIEDDSQRRDFTINSMYYDIESGEIIDFNGGLNDLNDKIIRTVGDPNKRFNEDLLRVLRAVRFANRYRFKLDQQLQDILSSKITLNGVSKERIRSEFLSTLKSAKNNELAIDMFHKYGFLDQIFPGLTVDLRKPRHFVTSSPIVCVARMLRTNTLDVLSKKLNKLTYSKTEIQVILFLISLITFSEESIVKYKRKLDYLKIEISDIKKFAKINRLSEKLIKGLLLYNLQIDGEIIKKEYGLKDKELGDKINELEVQSFKKFIENGFK